MTMNDIIVTEASQPTLFLALEAISHDRGSGAGHSNYAIPAGWQFFIYPAERALKTLPPDEFAEFCIGEHEAAQAIAHRTQDLHMAHRKPGITRLKVQPTTWTPRGMSMKANLGLQAM